jgi:hypothetical protein
MSATLYRPLPLIAMSRRWARVKEATECGCAAEVGGQRFAGGPGKSLHLESQSLGNKSCVRQRKKREILLVRQSG